jgi:hypothetical protein
MPCLSAALHKRTSSISWTKKQEKPPLPRVKTGSDTIIVLDNYSIHKSHQVRAKEREWQ